MAAWLRGHPERRRYISGTWALSCALFKLQGPSRTPAGINLSSDNDADSLARAFTASSLLDNIRTRPGERSPPMSLPAGPPQRDKTSFQVPSGRDPTRDSFGA
ncbi:hypothetical protein CaCOL14_003703 [Colletotrichum acutatum]